MSTIYLVVSEDKHRDDDYYAFMSKDAALEKAEQLSSELISDYRPDKESIYKPSKDDFLSPDMEYLLQVEDAGTIWVVTVQLQP